jgi:predicted phosphatase
MSLRDLRRSIEEKRRVDRDPAKELFHRYFDDKQVHMEDVAKVIAEIEDALREGKDPKAFMPDLVRRWGK